MKCPTCGFENEGDAKFCQSCGANIGATTPPPGEPASTPPPPPSAPQPRPPGKSANIDIGNWLTKAFNEVFGDIAGYLIVGLVVVIISGVTFSILAGPMIAGALFVIRRNLRAKQGMDISDIFNIGFGNFVPTFLLVFIPCLLIGFVWLILILLMFVSYIKYLAIIFAIIFGIVSLGIAGLLLPFFGFGLFFIVEEKLDLMDAAKKAWALIIKDPLQYWIFGILTSIIGGIGSIACGVGVFITYPVALVMMVYLIEEICKPE